MDKQMIIQIIIYASILILLATLVSQWHRILYWGHLLMERGLKSSVHYDRCHKIYTKLYQDSNPTRLSMDERRQKDLMSDSAFTYGEVRFYSFLQILELAGAKPGEIFYDLGSGAGKAVIIAWLAFDFAKVYGVEKLDSLYQLSNQTVQQLAALPELQQLGKKPDNIEFINGDFLNVDLSNADIVFIQSTCFYGSLWDGIMIKLQQLKPGARVIMTSRQIETGGFELKREQLFLMSWGLSRVSFYERI